MNMLKADGRDDDGQSALLSDAPSGWSRGISLGLFGVVLLAALVRSGFLLGPLSGDETHFYPSTVALIPFRMSKLETFREIASPTFFIVCSFVLQALGAHVFWARLIVLFCLVGCACVYQSTAHGSAGRAGEGPVIATLTWVLLLTFPYFVGCGVHFYTDIPGLFFGLLALGAYGKGRPGRGVLWAMLAVHCRQYFVFIPVSLAGLEAWNALRRRDGKALCRGALWLLPVISFAPYVLLWGGPSPMRAMDPRLADLPLVMPWHVTYLLAASGLYLLPLAVIVGLRHWTRAKAGWVIAGVALFLIFPPRPNLYYELIDAPIRTLGFLDDLLRGTLGTLGAQAALMAGIACAATLHYELFARTRGEAAAGLKWIIAGFWGMNLFSHLTWDKYLLPVLPVLYLLSLRHPEMQALGRRISSGVSFLRERLGPRRRGVAAAGSPRQV